MTNDRATELIVTIMRRDRDVVRCLTQMAATMAYLTSKLPSIERLHLAALLRDLADLIEHHELATVDT
ncbi:hypothetical protein [Bradyrhizobium sp. Bra64]|uniref:hypothetical protein n=1 Tax=Bradyrhizobium sp. Bra64 TaxID=2926009 RepID=UPI002117D9E5|nr:hypothetical protein [Bradyrhizobium sp. Bra64]